MAKTFQAGFFERNLLPIAGIVVGAFILNKLFGAKGSAEEKQAEQIEGAIAIETQAGRGLSYNDVEYTSKADQIYSAVFDTGTNEEAIYRVMRSMITDADLYALIRAFGSRRASIGDTLSPLTWWTLPEWMTNELSDSELVELNGILAANNIRYRF